MYFTIVFALGWLGAPSPGWGQNVELRVWAPLVIPAGTPRPPGGWRNDRTNFLAPCNLHLSAAVSLNTAGAEADTIALDFYANTNKLGSRKSIWMPEENPSAHARRNEAVPMHIRPAQFSMEELVWTNPPPGRYAVTVKARFGRKPPTVSAPVVITVSAPATSGS